MHAATLVTAGIYLLLRSSPILEYSPTALLVITLIGATTAFFGASCGLVINDLKRIIAMSTISQLGYFLKFFLSIIIIVYLTIFYSEVSDLTIYIYQSSILPLSCRSKINQRRSLVDKDKHNNIKYIDKYSEHTPSSRTLFRQKYSKVTGIYLWVNNKNNRSYVGKSTNLHQRINKYYSTAYNRNNKDKMAICGAIFVHDIDNFTLYILEILDSNSSKEDLSQRENHWFKIINCSYNIQQILQPFTGENHYRFGKKVSAEVRQKISNTLKGRRKSEAEKLKYVMFAKKKAVYCYDFDSGKFLMEFAGMRIMDRALGRVSNYIKLYVDKNKALICTIDNVNYKMLLKSNKSIDGNS